MRLIGSKATVWGLTLTELLVVLATVLVVGSVYLHWFTPDC